MPHAVKHAFKSTAFHGSIMTMAIALSLGGCVVPSSPNHEARFGDAARALRAQQIIDTAAPSRNTALAPVDGKAAAGAQKNYAESHGYTVKDGKPPSIQIPTQGAK